MHTTFTPESLFTLTSVAAPKLNIQQTMVAYHATEVMDESNDYISQIYLYDVNTKATIQVTSDHAQSYNPIWHPKLEQFLYIKKTSNQYALMCYDTTTQQTTTLLTQEQNMTNIMWSTDGEQIFFNMAVKDNDAPVEIPKEHAITARVIEDLVYRKDTIGYIDTHMHKQIFAFHNKTQAITQLTADSVDHTLYDVSPRDTKLLYGRLLEIGNPYCFETGVFELDINNSRTVHLTAQCKLEAFSHASYAPNMKYVAIVGSDVSYKSLQVSSLYLLNYETHTWTHLLQNDDVFVGDCGVSDFKQKPNSAPIQWFSTSDQLMVKISDYGRIGLHTVQLDGTRQTYSNNLEHIFDFDLSADNQLCVIAFSTPTMPNAIAIQHNTREIISHFHTNSTHNFSAYEEIHIKATDGGTIHGFLVKPHQFDVNKSYPLIYNIHGGPHVMHVATFHHEVQVMAAQGYAVLLINPRGSHGYGQHHTDGVIGQYGAGDYTDLMAALDYVLQQNTWINEQQLHVTGGSYGGFMTNWIVTQTQRFRSAVTQRSYCNVLSKAGCSDIGYYYTEWEMGTSLFDTQKLWQHSPLAYVQNVKTPLAFVHSEEDYRCPISEAEQFFTFLKILDVKTKFYRFPKSSHELSRNGIPSLRMERLHAILDWFTEN